MQLICTYYIIITLFQAESHWNPATQAFARLGTAEGLSQSTVFTMAQDQYGFLWLGGEDGLNRYDGRTMKTFEHRYDQANSLSDDWICSLFVDSIGQLWVGTRKGLDLYHEVDETFEHFPFPDGEREGWVIAQDEGSTLWYGTSDGLYQLDLQEHLLKPFPLEGQKESLEKVQIRAILYEEERIWLGSWGMGLMSLDRRDLKLTHYNTPPHYDHIRSLCRDSKGDLWLGTRAGLLCFDQEREHFQPIGQSMEITAIIEASDYSLWVGTNNQHVFMRPAGETSFSHLLHDPNNNSSLGHSTVWTILEDATGTLWFGHGTGGGCSKLGRRLFQHINTDMTEGLSSNHVWSIFKQFEGDLWVGTYSGLDRFPVTGGVERYRSQPDNPTSLSGDVIWTIEPEKDGSLWIGTYGKGLNNFDPDTGNSRRFLTLTNDPHSLSNNKVFSLAHDQRGRLWVGTHEGGLNILEVGGDKFERVPIAENGQGSSHDQIWCLQTDRNGDIWIGSNGGGLNQWSSRENLFRYWHHDKENPDSLGGDRVWSLAIDHRDRLWVGLKGAGLNLKMPGQNRFEHFTTKNSGLPNDTIYAIQEDAGGFLWLSTNQGLCKFQPENGEAQTFHLSHGLQNMEFNLGAAFVDEDGLFYFGGPGGLNIFNPSQVQPAPGPSAPVISAFSVLGKKQRGVLRPNELIRLKRQENMFSFEFAYLDHFRPKDYQYAYRLEGIDEEWQYLEENRNMARYTTVPPGEYHFRVKATDALGQWTPEVAALDVVVEPAFYDHTLFKVGLFLLPMFWACYFNHGRRVRRREMARWMRESREKERLALEECLHDGALKHLRLLKQDLDERSMDETSLNEHFMQALTQMDRTLRGVCHELLPPTLKDFGLEMSIRDYISCLHQENGGAVIHFDYEGLPVPSEFTLNLFRIFQKGIHNALEHAQAKNIHVTILVETRAIRLEVSDDGDGFHWHGDYRKLAGGQHYGLLSARERVAGMNGVLQITSQPGAGTHYRVIVPIPSPVFYKSAWFWLRDRVVRE